MTTNVPGPARSEMSPRPAAPRRYHPALITLHWLIAIFIFGAFFLAQANEGGDRGRLQPDQGNLPPAGQQANTAANFQPGNPPAALPQQDETENIFSAIGLHMLVGLTVLVLLIIRVLVRWGTKRPEWASTGLRLFDWVGNLTHLGLYLLTFAMVITGIILADRRGILARTFGVGSAPGARHGFNLGMFHEGVWILLILLIALHVGATLYHQFIVKDNLLGRMWFGRN